MFNWDELDFLTVLEVVPETQKDGCRYVYVVAKDGLRLEVAVEPFEADICIDLYREGIEETIVAMRFVQFRSAKRIRDYRGEFLEILNANSFSSYSHHHSGECNSLDVRIWIKPFIKVELI